MTRVFIIHGLHGKPNRAWRPWLMSELGKQEIYACALPMPDAEEPTCDSWIQTIQSAVGDDHDVYLVGHSLGARGVLRYLEQLKGNKIKGAVIISGRFGQPRSGILKSFYETPLDFDVIKNSCDQFLVIHGDDDPNIPCDDGRQIAEGLGCEFIVIPGGGHLSGHAGWNELPEARDALLQMMENNK